MSPYATFVAIALLSAPSGTPEAPIAAADWPELQAALHAVAIEWEILDPREVKYVLARPDDFENDLNLLRRRQHELNGVPKLQDSKRFPERALVSDLLSFNRAYRRHLDTRSVLEPDRGDLFREALRETDWLYQVWDAVRDARCEFYYVTVRRQALKRLHELVGTEAYHAGNLPPHVPLWRFQEVD
jgi:hypothetical protein